MNARLSQHPHSVRGIIDLTLGGTALLKPLQECVEASADSTLEDIRFVNTKSNYVAEKMRAAMEVFLREQLQPKGFIREVARNQCRLVCQKAFETHGYRAALRLRWCLGEYQQGSGRIHLNAAKGPETLHGIRQNREHFAQASLLGPSIFGPTTTREFNLWLVYQLDVRTRHLAAWLAAPKNIYARQLMDCLDVVELVNKPLDSASSLKFGDAMPPRPSQDDSDIDLPFGIRQAG